MSNESAIPDSEPWESNGNINSHGHNDSDGDNDSSDAKRIVSLKLATILIVITLCCTLCTLAMLLDVTSSGIKVATVIRILRQQNHRHNITKLNVQSSVEIEQEQYHQQQRERNIRWMANDHARRLRKAVSKGRSLPKQRFLIWLHIPKTGTSFVNTLIRWGCGPNTTTDGSSTGDSSDSGNATGADVFVIPFKEIPSDMSHLSVAGTLTWDWLFRAKAGRKWLRRHCMHRLVDEDTYDYSLNMHAGLKARHVEQAVAMFRLPKQRLYSSYLHINYHYRENRTSRLSLKQFLDKPRFLSQHAKVLLGRDYRDKQFVDSDAAARLVPLIASRLAFVGLTEQFELSVRLFHSLFGGVPHRLQFENVRPSILRYQSAARRSHSFRYDEREFEEGWDDVPDRIVHDAARRRFWRDVCANRLQIEYDGLGPVHIKTCLFHTYTSSLCYK